MPQYPRFRASRHRPVFPRSSVEHRQIDLAEAFGVGDQVDRNDLPARSRELEHDTRPSARNPYESRGAIHERRLRGPGASLERLGHGLRTADLRRRAHFHGCGVGSEHDVGGRTPSGYTE